MKDYFRKNRILKRRRTNKEKGGGFFFVLRRRPEITEREMARGML